MKTEPEVTRANRSIHHLLLEIKDKMKENFKNKRKMKKKRKLQI